MTTFIHNKAAIAAACLSLAVGLASAQSSRTPSNTTSPDPLQVNPVDGTPNSANGKLTPGTGTGSSRTVRGDNSVTVDPANTNRGAAAPDTQMTNPAIAPSGSSTTDSYPSRGPTRSGAGSTHNNPSGSDSMNNMEPTGTGTSTRAARRDRG